VPGPTSEPNTDASQWLLFVTDGEAPNVWRQICHAVSEGRLGIGAKISTAAADGRERVICVYTRDFNDKHDVGRVIRELQHMNLVPQEKKKQLWYKCDAFTYLDIMRGNDYGIRASLYGSDDFVMKKASGKNADGKAKASIMQLLDGDRMSLD
jgi:hypothetical protein